MSDTEQMTITEFLEARITEDEGAARYAAAAGAGPDWRRRHGTYVYGACVAGEMQTWAQAMHVTSHDPARVLAECAAKRAIVELHGPVKDDGWVNGKDHDNLWCGMCGSIDDSPEPYPCGTLKALAAVYSAHPDYRQEWSPS